MLTLRRQKTEEPSGLTRWLVSPEPVEQQYAAECLAEMGDVHGTDWLILLASTEDKKRWKVFRNNRLGFCLIFGLLYIALSLASKSPWQFVGVVLILLDASLKAFGKTIKASDIQCTAVKKLADSREPAALPALADALWKSQPSLKEEAIRGLVRLLPKIDKDTPLSERQWDLLLNEIDPNKVSLQKKAVDTKLVIGVLKAAVAADYFPAASRIKKLAETQKGIWEDVQIQPVAIHCYAVLEQARLAALSVQCPGEP